MLIDNRGYTAVGMSYDIVLVPNINFSGSTILSKRAFCPVSVIVANVVQYLIVRRI